MLRRAEPALVRYVYLLAPTDDPDHPRFVVDADVLDFDDGSRRGKPLPKGESDLALRAALRRLEDPAARRRRSPTCTPQLEPDFVYDEEFHVSSVSAYVPLTDDDGTSCATPTAAASACSASTSPTRKMRVALDRRGRLALEDLARA